MALAMNATVWIEAGAVPLNVSVAALKISQLGSACPVVSMAEYVSACPCGSTKAPEGITRENAWPAVQTGAGHGAASVGAAIASALNGPCRRSIRNW